MEPNWAKLTAALPAAADLDAVIALHEGTLQVGATAPSGTPVLCRGGRQEGARVVACTATIPAPVGWDGSSRWRQRVGPGLPVLLLMGMLHCPAQGLVTATCRKQGCWAACRRDGSSTGEMWSPAMVSSNGFSRTTAHSAQRTSVAAHSAQRLRSLRLLCAGHRCRHVPGRPAADADAAGGGRRRRRRCAGRPAQDAARCAGRAGALCVGCGGEACGSSGLFHGQGGKQ